QAQGKTLEADHRTDVYSLGVMLYQMLAGSPPFQGETFASLIFKHISEVPPKLGDMRSDAAPEWTGIVAKALSKAPDDRYQSVQALLNDARSAFPAAGDSATAMATQEDPNAAPERTTKSFSTLPAIASVLVLGGALAFWNARTNTKKHDKAKGPSIASVPAKDAPAIALDPVAEARATPIAAPVGSQASDDATASTSPNPVDSGVVPESPRATDKPKDPGSKTRARGTGLLRVTAFPWAHVYLDGRRIGQTPLSLSVPAGKHKLRLRNDATGVSKSHRFTMKKGGEKTIREKW
ncbi:MAG: PEGA domain-containing protein, partial [Myxococcales bacterium]|nr:PEGA domain-containing protein [Myxococcales bacterium]